MLLTQYAKVISSIFYNFQLKNSSVVEDITPDLTVYMLLNVILTGKPRVVIAVGKESVVTQQIIALVRVVQTTV